MDTCYNYYNCNFISDIKMSSPLSGTAGIYIVNANFKEKVPLLDAYAQAETAAKKIIETCQSEQDINLLDSYELSECVQNTAAANGLEVNCDNELEKPVYNFIENLHSCVRGADKDCTCEINLLEEIEIKDGNAILKKQQKKYLTK